MNGTEFLFVLGGAAVFYLVLSNRLIALLHPTRMEMAYLGADLLAEPSLPDIAKTHIQYHLDHAYSARRAWLYAILVPFSVAYAVKAAIKGKSGNLRNHCPAHLRAKYDRFFSLSFWSVVSASPAAAVLVIAELALCLVLFFPIGMIVRDAAKFAALCYDTQRKLRHLVVSHLHVPYNPF